MRLDRSRIVIDGEHDRVTGPLQSQAQAARASKEIHGDWPRLGALLCPRPPRLAARRSQMTLKFKSGRPGDSSSVAS